MRRTHLLLLALLLPGGVALGQEAAPPAAEEPPPPAEAPPLPPAPPPQSQAQEPGTETLLSGDISQGGYGGPVLTYSRILGHDALLIGGRGGWVANRQFVLGGGGFGMVTNVPAPEGAPDIGEDLRLDFAYGGLWLEYIFLPDKLLHGSIGTLIGAGDVSYERVIRPRRGDREVVSDTVFVLDPVIAAELNISRFMRLSAGVGYRYVGSVGLPGVSREDLSGFTGTVLLKFGNF